MWHEIVNDVVGDRPVLITFCPLCNTAIAFDREVDGREFAFSVSGFSVTATLSCSTTRPSPGGSRLPAKRSSATSRGRTWRFCLRRLSPGLAFKEAFPDGLVLSQETGYDRAYGANPYEGYDDIDSSPFSPTSRTPG